MAALFRRSEPSPLVPSLPSSPSFSLSPTLPFSLPPPLPLLRSRPLIAARGSGGGLKFPQRVRAEPGRQKYSSAF